MCEEIWGCLEVGEAKGYFPFSFQLLTIYATTFQDLSVGNYEKCVLQEYGYCCLYMYIQAEKLER